MKILGGGVCANRCLILCARPIHARQIGWFWFFSRPSINIKRLCGPWLKDKVWNVIKHTSTIPDRLPPWVHVDHGKTTLDRSDYHKYFGDLPRYDNRRPPEEKASFWVITISGTLRHAFLYGNRSTSHAPRSTARATADYVENMITGAHRGNGLGAIRFVDAADGPMHESAAEHDPRIGRQVGIPTRMVPSTNETKV